MQSGAVTFVSPPSGLLKESGEDPGPYRPRQFMCRTSGAIRDSDVAWPQGPGRASRLLEGDAPAEPLNCDCPSPRFGSTLPREGV